MEWEELCLQSEHGEKPCFDTYRLETCPRACVFESVSRECDRSLLMVTETVCSPRRHLVACVSECATIRARLANGVFASVGSERDIPN